MHHSDINSLDRTTERETISGVKNEPWSPADATDYLRDMARSPEFSIVYKLHSTERMAKRSIISSDVLYVLKNGFVLQDAVSAEKTVGYFKYTIECISPNSDGRTVRLVVIPNARTCKIKMITVMWADEVHARAGTLMEGAK